MRRTLVLGSLIGVLLVSLLVREIVLAMVRSRSAELRAQVLPAHRDRAEGALDVLRLELARALLVGEQHESLRRALASTDDTARRRRGFDALEAIARDLGAGSLRDLGRPDFVALVDATGRVLVRDLDPNRMRGHALEAEIPALERARRTGQSSFGTFRRAADGAVLVTAAEPLVGGEALVVAYQLGDGIARRMAAASGQEVGIVIEGKLLGSSMAEGAARDAVFAARAAPADPSVAVETEEGEQWIDVSSLDGLHDVPVSMAIVSSADEAGVQAALGNVLLAAAFVLAGLAYVLADRLAKRVLAPVARLEDALLAVMNGQESLGITVESEELGGLAFRMEQVIETLRDRASAAVRRRPSLVTSTEPSSATVQTASPGVILRPAELGAA